MEREPGLTLDLFSQIRMPPGAGYRETEQEVRKAELRCCHLKNSPEGKGHREHPKPSGGTLSSYKSVMDSGA